MSLDRRDRIEAAIAVLLVLVAAIVAGVYIIGRFLLDAIFRIF